MATVSCLIECGCAARRWSRNEGAGTAHRGPGRARASRGHQGGQERPPSARRCPKAPGGAPPGDSPARLLRRVHARPAHADGVVARVRGSRLPYHRGLPSGPRESHPANEPSPRRHDERLPECHRDARVLSGLRRSARDEPVSTLPDVLHQRARSQAAPPDRRLRTHDQRRRWFQRRAPRPVRLFEPFSLKPVARRAPQHRCAVTLHTSSDVRASISVDARTSDGRTDSAGRKQHDMPSTKYPRARRISAPASLRGASLDSAPSR